MKFGLLILIIAALRVLPAIICTTRHGTAVRSLTIALRKVTEDE